MPEAGDPFLFVARTTTAWARARPASALWLDPATSAIAAAGVTTETQAAITLEALDRDVERFPERPVLWPLLIGAWKRKHSGA